MRIWIGRPEPGAARTAARLVALGHDPLVAPVLVAGPSGASPPPGPYDAALLTSAQAVAALAAAGFAGPIFGGPVFAVGARTAAAAQAAGFVSVITAEGDAAALARLVRTTMAPGARLLHAAGQARKPEPETSLRAAGYAVVVWVAYAAEALPALPAPVAAALAGTDAAAPLTGALHYSRRSAETARDLCAAAGFGGAFRALTHYCLSADVAVPLVSGGVPVHFVPAWPNEDALLDGLSGAGRPAPSHRDGHR